MNPYAVTLSHAAKLALREIDDLEKELLARWMASALRGHPGPDTVEIGHVPHDLRADETYLTQVGVGFAVVYRAMHPDELARFTKETGARYQLGYFIFDIFPPV